jgi:hypothetical protein
MSKAGSGAYCSMHIDLCHERMKSTSNSTWSRYAALAVALLFAIGFAATETMGTSAGDDGAAVSNAAGQPSQFVMSGGAIPDSDAPLPSSAAVARADAASTVIARAHKD